MTGWLAFMVWLGGMVEDYRRRRAAGQGRISAGLDAPGWPVELGRRLAASAAAERDGGENG